VAAALPTIAQATVNQAVAAPLNLPAAAPFQVKESRQESGGGQDAPLAETDGQGNKQSMKQVPASGSEDDLIGALPAVGQSVAPVQANRALWQQASEVCFAQEQETWFLVEPGVAEFSVDRDGSSALQLAALALALGGTWASAPGKVKVDWAKRVPVGQSGK
jgi:hypothetical protein